MIPTYKNIYICCAKIVKHVVYIYLLNVYSFTDSVRLFNLSDKEEVFKETSVKIVAVLAMSHNLGNTGHSVPAPTPVYAA